MRITNAKIYINGGFTEGGLDFNEKIIESGSSVTGEADIKLNGEYIIPGLVDVHTHGAMGEDVSDGKPEAMPILGRYYAKEGVTSWAPTTMTLKEPELTKAIKAITSYERPDDGAKVAGIHMEGPFLSSAKKGAQNEDNLHEPDFDMFMRLYEASLKTIKLITIAPEEAGAADFIKKASSLVNVSVGHTACDYDTAVSAFEAGANHITHTFNGMPGIHHRNPGVIPAASEKGAYAELISDGFHIHPSVVRLTHRMFGNRLCLISDSLRCAAMPDGEYELGGQPITVTDGKAFIKGTTTIAGSSIHLMEGLRRAVSFGLPLEEAIYAATAAPAKSINMYDLIGSLDKGKYADFVILDKNLQVKAVYINGKKI